MGDQAVLRRERTPQRGWSIIGNACPRQAQRALHTTGNMVICDASQSDKGGQLSQVLNIYSKRLRNLGDPRFHLQDGRIEICRDIGGPGFNRMNNTSDFTCNPASGSATIYGQYSIAQRLSHDNTIIIPI